MKVLLNLQLLDLSFLCMCEPQLAALRRFTKYEPVDRIALQRKVAARVIAAERYTVA